jgi:WhiB family redox-sensing transcriptional regulator
MAATTRKPPHERITRQEAARRDTSPRSHRKHHPRTDRAWQESAACRAEDLNLFFGPDGESRFDREEREEKAKAICRRCPVAQACLDGAIARGERAGVWGGLNADEIAAERRRRARRAA